MEDFIPTRAASLRKKPETLHSSVVFESYKKKVKDSKSQDENKLKRKCNYDSDEQEDDEPMDEKKKQELEMKRFRYDVIKLGMSGFEKNKAKEAKIALAVSLGAKPPRNRPKNYKKLIKERKIEKIREEKAKKTVSGFKPSQLTKNKNKGKQSFKKGGKKSDGILDVYGKVTKDKKVKKR